MQWQDGGKAAGIPDALWMIEFTSSGFLGLASLTLYLLAPSARLWWQMRRTDWRNPAVMPAVGLAIIVVLGMIDNLFNAMLNPMFMLAAGGLGSLVITTGIHSRRARLQEGDRAFRKIVRHIAAPKRGAACNENSL